MTIEKDKDGGVKYVINQEKWFPTKQYFIHKESEMKINIVKC